MQNIIYEIKNFEGFVLGIGSFKDKLLNEVLKNDKIAFTILTNDAIKTKGKDSKLSNNSKSKKQKINIKKLKKTFKRNKPNYMLIDALEINDYLNFFVKDSLYITKSKLYIYTSDKNIDLNDIYNLYKRYNEDIEYTKKYIIVNNENYKNKPFKNLKYLIKDTIFEIYNLISNVITS